MIQAESTCRIHNDGRKCWYINGKLHREDGPAMILANGTKYWFVNDKLHRTDGPAIIRYDGSIEWWLSNKPYTFKDYVIEAKWTDEQIVMYKLKYF